MNMNNNGGMGMNNQIPMMNYNNNMMPGVVQNNVVGMGGVGGQGVMPMASPAMMGSPSQMVPQVQTPIIPQQSNLQNPAAQPGNNPLTLQTPTLPGGPMIQQQQHPQMVASQSLQQQQNSQNQFNIVSLCKFGQETVQDIVSRFQEVFQALRISNPPNGTTSGQEKKVQEQFRTIRLLFKRVRILYDKCNDSCEQGMEYTHVESLIPLKDEIDHKPDPSPSEEYKKTLQENRELLDAVMLKNKQLREVIDRIRIIIWEINTMLNMRRS